MIKKILVSQPKPASEKSPYFDIADKFKVEIVFRPFIKVEGLGVKDFRQQKIALADFPSVIFTAKTAVDNYFRLAEETRFTVPDTMKYFCTTKSVADYLQKYIVYRKRKIFKAETGRLADLLPFMSKNKTDRYLLIVSDVSNPADADIFVNEGYDLTRAIMYRTVSNDFTADENFDYDMLAFFSPQGIASLKKSFPDFDQGDIVIATFGANTAKAAADAGLTVQVEAPKQAPSMTGAIELYLRQAR